MLEVNIMKEFLINLIKLFLSIVVVLFIEEYFFKVVGLVGIELSNTPLIRLIIYSLLGIIIYIIYGEEIRKAFSKYQNKLGSNLLYTIISYIIVFIAMMLLNYILKLLATNLNLTYTGLNFSNIFNEAFDLNLIVIFIVDMLIIPFVKVIVFVLGINNLIKGQSALIVSGLCYALYTGFMLGGTLSNIFFDVIDEIVLFMLLSYLYRKNDNIVYSILTLIFYGLFSSLIITKLV